MYTDKNSNTSAFDKQLHTLSTDFISERDFLQKINLLFVACVGVVKIKYVFQRFAVYNLNKHLRLTTGFQFSFFFSEKYPCPSRANFQRFQLFKFPFILPALIGKNN